MTCVVVVQLFIGLFSRPWTEACQASLSFTISQSLLKLMSIEPVMPSNHHILCRPLLLLPSIFPSIRVFSNESALCIRWPKHWSFSFTINPSSEYSGLISFRINGFHLLSVQGTLKSLLQNHSPKTSILWHLAFFMVQLSHPYMTTGNTIALTRQTFAGKVMFLTCVKSKKKEFLKLLNQEMIQCQSRFPGNKRNRSVAKRTDDVCRRRNLSWGNGRGQGVRQGPFWPSFLLLRA